MLNEQFTWLTPFIQLECPSFAWRTKDAKDARFFFWRIVHGARTSDVHNIRGKNTLRFCVFALTKTFHTAAT